MNEAEMDAIVRAVSEKMRRRARGGVTVEPVDLGWRMPIAVSGGTPAAVGGSGAGSTAPLRRAGAARVADYVDHTLLKAEAQRGQIDTLCDEARQYRFAAVCINGSWVAHCARRLTGSGVKVATVAGFPLGAMSSRAKAEETRIAVEDGADEIDMVAAIGHILDEDWDYVEDDIAAVVEAARGRAVKVILETATLEPMSIVKASALARLAGARFVKTSTGFHAAGGATVEAVALMRMVVGDALGVKAAGGIRECETALRMIAAGASRIGTSSGVQFVECIGAGPASLSELLTDPAVHAGTCRTGLCGGEY